MNRKDTFLSLLSGVLLVLSFPKFDLEVLAWVALVPLLLAIRGKRAREAFLLSFLTGSVFFAGLLYWIATVTIYNRFVIFGLLLLVFYLALYFGLFGLLASRRKPGTIFNLQLSTFNYLYLPSLWISLELIRTYLFSGFPWGLLGYSQYLNLPLIQISSFTGVYGVSFLIVLVNVAPEHRSQIIPWRAQASYTLAGTGELYFGGHRRVTGYNFLSGHLSSLWEKGVSGENSR